MTYIVIMTKDLQEVLLKKSSQVEQVLHVVP
jgi:hypothetical protein